MPRQFFGPVVYLVGVMLSARRVLVQRLLLSGVLVLIALGLGLDPWLWACGLGFGFTGVYSAALAYYSWSLTHGL